MIARLVAVTVILSAMLLKPFPALAQADLALVLAVDVSSSVNEDRFKLQREGIAEGLRSIAILRALGDEPPQTMELAILEWSEEQALVVDWTIIRDRADMDAVVNRLRVGERPHVGWKTDVGAAIAKAINLFDSAPLTADRRIIDVSGDGRQNQGKISADRARDTAVAKDITINGLPITSGDEPDVDQWYRDHVVGGGAAFVIVANGHANFAESFRQKLVREVAGEMAEKSIAAAP